jgi:hypoxanthine phosphoribosyltransferase
MYYISWEQFDADARELTRRIRASGKVFTSVYGIPRSGLVLATYLSHVLKLPLSLKPSMDPHALIVDDNNVTGASLVSYVQNGYTTAVLVQHVLSSVKPTFFIHVTDDWPIFPWEIDSQEARLLRSEENTGTA